VKTDLPARHDSRPPAQQEQRALILEVDAEPKSRAYHLSVYRDGSSAATASRSVTFCAPKSVGANATAAGSVDLDQGTEFRLGCRQMTETATMSVGLILLRFTIPCAPDDNLRTRILRTLKAGVKFIEEAPSEGAVLEVVMRRGGTPETGLPLEGVLYDEKGLCGMYTVQLNP